MMKLAKIEKYKMKYMPTCPVNVAEGPSTSDETNLATHILPMLTQQTGDTGTTGCKTDTAQVKLF